MIQIEGDCSAFYLCAGGVPNIIQFCNTGTMFNGQTCVWPDQADCDGAWRQPATTTTTTTSTTSAPSTSGQALNNDITGIDEMANSILDGSGLG